MKFLNNVSNNLIILI